MNALQQHIMPYFRWKAPLGRGAFLGSSVASALTCAFSQVMLLMMLALLDESSLIWLAWLIFLPGSFVCAVVSPFTLLFYFFLLDLAISFNIPPPAVPAWAAIVLALLFALLMAGSLLRLIALTVRRRKDAGLRPANYFAFSTLYLGLLLILCMATLGSASAIWLVFYALVIVPQCAMLFHPTKPLPPSHE